MKLRAGSRTCVWLGMAAAAALVIGAAGRSVVHAAPPTGSSDLTFARDVAPVLQRSCQNCHRPDGVAPMSLVTYEEVRPFARAIKQRISIGPHRGVMPPWYMEKNIGIQKFKDDPSLSDDEIATIAKWSDGGAPKGDPAEMPAPLKWDDDA